MDKTEVLDADGADFRVYELGYLLSPAVGDENLPKTFGDLKAGIEKHGAIFISEDYPKLIPLAYEMERNIANKKNKFTNAYFGWMKFEVDPGAVAAIEKDLKLNDLLVRFLFIKTVRENTLASRRTQGFGRRRMIRKTEDGENSGAETKKEEPKVEVSSEAIDQKIDELITA